MATTARRQGSRDRALAGKKRIRARRQARRASPILAAPVAQQPVALYGLEELRERTVRRLQSLAKTMGLHGYSNMKKDELVEFIYRSEENQAW